MTVTDGRGRRVAGGGLARWLAAIAPVRVEGEIAIALVTDAHIRKLNRQYRGKDDATDVLSFSVEDFRLKPEATPRRGGSSKRSTGVASAFRRKIAGDIVYTMPPYALGPLFQRCEDMDFKYDIESEDVPDDVLYKMSKIPYCIQSCDENGMEIDQFNTHPATIATAASFSKASAGLEEYVGGRMAVVASRAVPA